MSSEHPRVVEWLERPVVPPAIGAVLNALRFDREGLQAHPEIPEHEWMRALATLDRVHLTLPLYQEHQQALPKAIARECESRLAKNTLRFERIIRAFQEISGAFQEAGVEAVLLKGFTAHPDFVSDLGCRVQYDLDFFCSETSIYGALDVLRKLGYEPYQAGEGLPTDHLPAMIRKTGWQWKGDYYDPEMPLSVDLHYRFWDAATERFDAPGVDDFCRRAQVRTLGEVHFAALHRLDALAYHCIHLLRHMLRGSLGAAHVYELAWLLDRRAGDLAFWHEWLETHPAGLRRLQVIAFCLARSWFGCRLAPQIEVAAGDLPAEVVRWFDRYAAAPMEALFRPNKHEIWLHLALVESARDKRAVLRRRLLPLRPPGQVDSVHVPEEQLTFRLRVRRRWRYAVYVAERCRHHASVLPGFVFHWIRWRSPFGELSKGFWVYLTTASFFNLGLFLFYLIYNLHLMDRGFQESFLGVMNGAFTAGSVSGALPAGAMLQRLGLTRMLQVCIGSTAVVGAFRVLIPSADALIGLAFMAGAAFSLWVVSIPPAIAQLTSESVRPRAFSTFFGVSIAIGVVGGLAGGHMPQWLATPEVSGKQAALLVGCGLMAIALWPAARLRFGAAPSRVRLRYPLGSFVRRFLISLVGWNFAVGAFNPFFNTFFSRHLHARIEDIGAIFSSGQVAQVVAMAAAPVVLNRLGLVSGVTATQVATGLALAALAWSSALWVAAIAYAVYAACQYMSEPGIYSLLMSRVRPDEQSGASSLNFFAAFTAQAMAAALAGIALSRYGYQTVVALIAVLIVLSSLLFRTLLTGYERRE